MKSFAEISEDLGLRSSGAFLKRAEDYLQIGENVLEHWNLGRGFVPTQNKIEGFRLLALHRQGSKGEPSFNACRETCRELAYHYNLIIQEPGHPDTGKRLEMMRLIATHLFLFVSGEMEYEKLGEFCCASRPIRSNEEKELN